MPDLIIYGASDDLVEVEGAFEEEFTVPSGTWRGKVLGPDGSHLIVVAEWCGERIPDGWGVWVVDGSRPLPPWPSRVGRAADWAGLAVGWHGNDGPALIIDVPEGTVVTTEQGEGQ